MKKNQHNFTFCIIFAYSTVIITMCRFNEGVLTILQFNLNFFCNILSFDQGVSLPLRRFTLRCFFAITIH